jgi:hypothetical protein
LLPLRPHLATLCGSNDPMGIRCREDEQIREFLSSSFRSSPGQQLTQSDAEKEDNFPDYPGFSLQLIIFKITEYMQPYIDRERRQSRPFHPNLLNLT